MKHPFLTLFTAVALLVVPAFTQEDAEHAMPQPAKELAKYSRMLGYWEGSGTVVEELGGTPNKWTSTSHVRKVLDDHFIREDMSVVIEGEQFTTPLQMVSFYGFDQNDQRYMSHGLNNMGSAEAAEVTWKDANTMVVASTSIEQGQYVVERWTTTLGDGEISFVGHRAVGSGDFFVHVKGSAKRVGDKPTNKVMDASHAFMTKASPEIGKLKSMVGTFRFEGEMLMMPGEPMVPVSGESVGEMIFGGTALLTEVHGDPIDGYAYHGWYVMVWNERDKHYVSMGLNNMGEAAMESGKWVNGTELVMTNNRPYYGGIPSAHSGIMTVAKDGSLKSYSSHSIIGTNKPVKSFEVMYTRK